jgi:hypothetical protein
VVAEFLAPDLGAPAPGGEFVRNVRVWTRTATFSLARSGRKRVLTMV